MNRLKDEVDEPETIVDRLRGIYVNKVGEYPSAEPPYKTSPIMQEAAREIERLRRDLTESAMEEADLMIATYRLREALGNAEHALKAFCDGDDWIGTMPGNALEEVRSVLYNKKPAEAG